MDTVYIAFIAEPYEPNRIIGVFTTPSLAHRAIAEYLETEPRIHNGGGFVDEYTVYSTPTTR